MNKINYNLTRKEKESKILNFYKKFTEQPTIKQVKRRTKKNTAAIVKQFSNEPKDNNPEMKTDIKTETKEKKTQKQYVIMD